MSAKRPQTAETLTASTAPAASIGTTAKNSLDIGTQAGRDTQAALDNIAATALKVAQTLDPIQRTEFLAGARTEYVKAAVAAGMTEDAAKKLADTVLGLSKVKGQPRIVIDASGAWHVIDETARKLERLTRPTHKINIQAQATKNRGQVADAQSGGSWALGGWTGPGGKYQPAGLVHADEFVFSKEATHGNVAFLSDLHRSLRGYADGGLVQRFPQQMIAATPIDYDRLALAMSAVRPMYGDVHIQPHNYNEFKRQMQQDQRASGLDGVRR